MKSGREKLQDSGMALIIYERERQISQEDFSLEHDDTQHLGAMNAAAYCYYKAARMSNDNLNESEWPFDKSWWKPTDKVTCLIKAGALYQAEIERLKRFRDKIASMLDGMEPGQLLVKVEYELPPTRGILTTYFDDEREESNEPYLDALKDLYPKAICRGITRAVPPIKDGKGGC